MKYLYAIWLPTTFTAVTSALSYYVSLVFILLAFFGVCDVRARYADFKRMQSRELSVPLMRKMRPSRCQRNSIKAAFWDKKDYIDWYYKSIGYCWYHFLPDGTLSIKDNCYLKPKFYLNLMGVRT